MRPLPQPVARKRPHGARPAQVVARPLRRPRPQGYNLASAATAGPGHAGSL
jgi:hypothetical protein